MASHDVIQILSPVPNVKIVFSFDDSHFYQWIVVTLVKAEVLWIIEGRFWHSDYDLVKSLFLRI